MGNRLLMLATLVAVLGCASSSQDVATTPSKPGEGVAQNPTGRPTSPDAQALDQRMSAAGQAQAAGQAAAAAAAAAAMKAGK